MASAKKEPTERKMVSASEAKKKSAPKKETVKKAVSKDVEEVAEDVAEETEEAVEEPKKKMKEAKHAPEGSTPKGRASGLRVGAVILWVVGILFEVAAILILNGTIYLGDNMMLYLIIALAVDLVAVVIASQLWKKANHIDPASEKNKVKFFLWNNLGVIASIIAFLPILILFLTNKDLDPKTKKISSIVAAAALLLAVGTSVDYNPVSQEKLAEANEQAAVATTDGTVYWTTFGKKYHYDEDCQAIKNSSTVYYGSVDEAVEANRTDLCSFCEKRHEDQAALPEEPDTVEDEAETLDDAA